MVQMGDAKMSKSVGNVVSLAEAIAVFGRGPLRLWYLSAQHRTPLTFDDQRLEDARIVFQRFVTFLRAARRAAGDAAADGESGRDHRGRFVAAMDDDLNAPVAVAALHELAGTGSDLLRAAGAGDVPARAALTDLADTLVDLADGVLGLGLTEALASAAAVERRMAPLVEAELARRAEARAAKDFATADAIRDELVAAGVVVEDGANGASWYVSDLPGTPASV
jgi:cysteinyl-tRNA synthetase